MSKAVQDRAQRCLTVVVAGYAYADVLVEAALRMMRDFLLRERERIAGGGAESEERQGGPSVRDMMRLSAADLTQRCETMVETDAALARSRAELRRCRAHRDRRKRRLYRQLAETRDLLKGLFGYQAACDLLGIRGPTPRDPHVLLKEARHAAGVLADPSQTPADYDDVLRLSDWAKLLEPLCDALDEAIDAVIAADAAEIGALDVQRQAIARFDRDYKHTARLYERALDWFGLPTLASTVRPGVKRRGRPRKAQRVDLFPDLVEQALGWNVPPPQIENLDDGPAAEGGPKTGEEKSSSDPRKLQAGEEKSESGSRKLTAGDRKSETGSRKQAEGGLKSETGSRKLSESGQKSESGARKLSEPEEKSESGPRKLANGESSRLNATVGVNSKECPAVAQRSTCRRRIVHRVEPIPARLRRRARRPASSRLAASASAWWRRFRGGMMS